MVKKTAFAKLDLAISISPIKSNDGYYPVDYIDCQIDLSDELLIEQKEKDIAIICDHPGVPKNKENFIYQAVQLLKELKGDKNLGAKIVLKKGIPIKAGFGGGSSDGAAVLRGLEELWEIKLNEKQLASLAKVLGKDFYYSLHGGLCEIHGEGKNYRVIPLSSALPKFWLLIVVPFEEKPSTGWVYEHLNTKDIGRNLDKLENLKEVILEKNKSEDILKNLNNDFESSVSRFYPVIKRIKKDLVKFGSAAEIMAGAGLAVVGFFENKEKAQKAKGKLEGKYQKVLIAKTIN
jgi:4-diphosphocytidyl-2-C-methyl-D-erythritol kinase